MKWLVKIKRFFFGPRTELEFTEHSLKKYRKDFDDMTNSFQPGIDVCCPNCKYGGSYHDLAEKIERIEERIKYLKKGKTK